MSTGARALGEALQGIAAGTPPWGGGGSDGILVATKRLAHADILTIASRPVEVVPAPGEHKLLFAQAIYLLLAVPTANYTGLGAIFLDWPDTAGHGPGEVYQFGSPLAHDFGYQAFGTADLSYNSGTAASVVSGDNHSDYSNQPLVIYAGSTDPAGGDPLNTLSVKVWYAVVDAAAFG